MEWSCFNWCRNDQKRPQKGRQNVKSVKDINGFLLTIVDQDAKKPPHLTGLKDIEIFHGIPRNRALHNYFIPCHRKAQSMRHTLRAAHDWKVGCNTVEYTTFLFSDWL